MIQPFYFRQNSWPVWQRSLFLTCLILFIPFTVATVIVLALIPLYLSNHATHQMRSPVGSPLTVAYLVIDSNTRSFTNADLGMIDRQRMARSFERSLGLRLKNVLKIVDISSNFTQGNGIPNRRKRYVKCDQDPQGLDGPVLIFNFNLTHPIQRTCQTIACANQTFQEIYQQFQSVPNVSIDFTNVTRELRLCSFDIIPYEGLIMSENSSSTLFNPTTHSSSNPLVTTTAVTPSPSLTTTINDSSVPFSSIFTTTTTTTTVTTGSTIISTIEPSSLSSTLGNFTTASATVEMMSTTTTSILVNDSEIDLKNCLQKIPFTQESVPPYRIIHTSTIFARDDPTLIIVGAAKIESNIFLQSIQRDIIINGITVYRLCQRTIDVSIPIIHSSNA